MNIDFNRMYRLHIISRRTTLHVDPVDPITQAKDLFRGDWIPPRPLEFRHQSGHSPMDVIGTTWGFLWLVSDKFVQALRNAHTTGWNTYEVIVYGKAGEVLPGYYGLSVRGRCGPILKERSQCVLRPSPGDPETAEEWLLGELFDPATWDGADVFCAERTALKLLSERAYIALRDAKLTNVIYTPLSQVEWQ